MNQSLTSERLQKLVECIVLLPIRMRHRHRERAKHRARVNTLIGVRNTLLGATKIAAGNAKTVFNVGMYLIMLDQDIAFFTDDLVNALGDRKRAFIAKQWSVLLYEAAEDLPQLLGRDFRDAAKSLGASEEQIIMLNSSSSELNQFWQTHREFLGSIRNILGAHRDHDALRYAEALETLRPLSVMNLAAELSQHINKLVNVLIELSSLTIGPLAVFRDIVVTGKKKKPRSSGQR
jgi:hypothetical protein